MTAKAQQQAKTADITLPDEIVIVIGYGANKLRFTEKMLTLEEENAWANVDAAKAGVKRTPREDYAWIVERLAAMATRPLEGQDEDGVYVPVIDGADPGASVRGFFDEYTAAKERLAVTAFVEYRQGMVPTKSFL